MPSTEVSGNQARDFSDAQFRDSEEYFLYVIESGEHAGGGTSCYFWFESFAQLLESIKENYDFWEWQNDFVGDDLNKIIGDSGSVSELNEELKSELGAYMHENAGIILYYWGKFSGLCSGLSEFCIEVRADFRSSIEDDECHSAEAEGEDGRADLSRPISLEEVDAFVRFLNQTPS
jgi:hypothetical protein